MTYFDLSPVNAITFTQFLGSVEALAIQYDAESFAIGDTPEMLNRGTWACNAIVQALTVSRVSWGQDIALIADTWLIRLRFCMNDCTASEIAISLNFLVRDIQHCADTVYFPDNSPNALTSLAG